jgi:hypothetical protein
MTLVLKNVIISSSCQGGEMITSHIIKHNEDILPIAIKFETFTIIGPSILDKQTLNEYRYLLISNDINLDNIIALTVFSQIQKLISNATSNDTICYLILYMKFKTIELNYSKQYNQLISKIKDLDYSNLDMYKKYVLLLSNRIVQLTKNDIVYSNDINQDIWKLLYLNKILMNISINHDVNYYNLIIDWIYANGDNKHLFDDANKKANLISGGKIKDSLKHLSHLHKSLVQTDVDKEVLDKLIQSNNLLTTKNYTLPDLSIVLFYDKHIEEYHKNNITNIDTIIEHFLINSFLLNENDLILNVSNLDNFYLFNDKFYIKDFSSIILGLTHTSLNSSVLNHIKDSIKNLIQDKNADIDIQNIHIETLLVAYSLLDILKFLSGLHKYYKQTNTSEKLINIIKQIYKDIITVLLNKEKCGLKYIESILITYFKKVNIKYKNNMENCILSYNKKMEIIDRSKYISKYIQHLEF